MKTITTFVALWMALGSSSSHADIQGSKKVDIDFTNETNAQARATWSEPGKLTVSEEGLGWDGDGAASRDGWIETMPVALGLSWRPTSAISVRVSIQPSPQEYTLGNGKKYTGDAGELYVRYSPDLKHWSSWQALQRSEPPSTGETKAGRCYNGTVRVPYREQSVYNQLVSEYSHLDVPWKSDEEAAVQWILKRDPDFFSKYIPFIGYAEFLFEGEFRGGQRIKTLRVDIAYAMGGKHSLPRDDKGYNNPHGPWRHEDRSSPKTGQDDAADRLQTLRSATNSVPPAGDSSR
jgi:hypothetical protein